MPRTLKDRPPVAAIALSIPEAAQAAGLGRSSLYALIKQGLIVPRQFGARRLIIVSELEAALAGLPAGGDRRGA